MPTIKVLAIAASIGALLPIVNAAPIIRDAALIETYEVEGISLSTPPEDAFNLLKSRGYDTGEVATFDQWGSSAGLNFFLGDYGLGDVSSITLSQYDGRLIQISESLNRRGIDYKGAVNGARSHFNVTTDEIHCRLNAAETGGGCQVRDSDDPEQITAQLTMTAVSNMRMQSVSRPQDLRDSVR